MALQFQRLTSFITVSFIVISCGTSSTVYALEKSFKQSQKKASVPVQQPILPPSTTLPQKSQSFQQTPTWQNELTNLVTKINAINLQNVDQSTEDEIRSLGQKLIQISAEVEQALKNNQNTTFTSKLDTAYSNKINEVKNAIIKFFGDPLQDLGTLNLLADDATEQFNTIKEHIQMFQPLIKSVAQSSSVYKSIMEFDQEIKTRLKAVSELIRSEKTTQDWIEDLDKINHDYYYTYDIVSLSNLTLPELKKAKETLTKQWAPHDYDGEAYKSMSQNKDYQDKFYTVWKNLAQAFARLNNLIDKKIQNLIKDMDNIYSDCINGKYNVTSLNKLSFKDLQAANDELVKRWVPHNTVNADYELMEKNKKYKNTHDKVYKTFLETLDWISKRISTLHKEEQKTQPLTQSSQPLESDQKTKFWYYALTDLHQYANKMTQKPIYGLSNEDYIVGKSKQELNNIQKKLKTMWAPHTNTGEGNTYMKKNMSHKNAQKYFKNLPHVSNKVDEALLLIKQELEK